MRVTVLTDRVPRDPAPDLQDTLVQAQTVTEALVALGHTVDRLAFSLDLGASREALRSRSPDLVFNLVESVEGEGRFIALAPLVLEHLGLPFTGASSRAMFLSSCKPLSKSVMETAGLPTPKAYTLSDLKAPRAFSAGAHILKSAWEHASQGIEDAAVVHVDAAGELLGHLLRHLPRLGGEGFAEAFVEGREFNLSLLGSREGITVLPPAEILFVDYPPEKRRIVGYRAKWDQEAFEYHHTPRRFLFPSEDASLLARLTSLSRRCWDLFELRGYARVDFRVDPTGAPWILEINANPCLSPDAGFLAAASEAGLSAKDVITRILEDTPLGSPALEMSHPES